MAVEIDAILDLLKITIHQKKRWIYLMTTHLVTIAAVFYTVSEG